MSIEFDSLSDEYRGVEKYPSATPSSSVSSTYLCRAFCLQTVRWLSGKEKTSYRGFGSLILVPLIRFLAAAILGGLSSFFGASWHIGKAAYHQFFDYSPDAKHKVREHLKSLVLDAIAASGIGTIVFGLAYAYDPVMTKNAEFKD